MTLNRAAIGVLLALASPAFAAERPPTAPPSTRPPMTAQELSVRDQAAFDAMAEVRSVLEEKLGATRGDLAVAHVLVDALRSQKDELQKQVDDLKAKYEPKPEHAP